MPEPWDDDYEPPPTLARAEEGALSSGELLGCPYCHVRVRSHKPGCRGLDIHPECPYCHNISGHRSAKCPGRAA